ncbi:DUF2321 domain-containing protein [Nonomuraea wenchangensis]|uniref:DUF2321 domain-containing protein n=1 Tax=Nonomuraea wenchangensis TaxID=568860 RepID=UPI00384F85D7
MDRSYPPKDPRAHPEGALPPPRPEAIARFWRHEGEPGIRGYRAATVCRRGHLQEADLVVPPEYLVLGDSDLGKCSRCGADVLGACQECGLRIRGLPISHAHNKDTDLALPKFCDRCGHPHPWSTRQDRIFELENLLDQQDIDEADKDVVREHLARLQALDPIDDPEGKEARKRWGAIIKRAPELLKGAGSKAAETLIDIGVRRALGLD